MSQIAIGDNVLAYMGVESMKPVVVEKNGILNNKYGQFKHNDIVGKNFGSIWTGVGQDKRPTWLLVLKCTPEMWTETVAHRTQILYQVDISLILMYLRLRPGSIVYESGTGSGSLSTSIARTIAPHGHLHTFEFNEDRVVKARADFITNKIDKIITVHHRDTVQYGFPILAAPINTNLPSQSSTSESLTGGNVDAIFLDLPAPWSVIPTLPPVIRHGAVVCSFSPCIEQVQRTCTTFTENGFINVRMFEGLRREADPEYPDDNLYKLSPDFGDTLSDSVAGTKTLDEKTNDNGDATIAAKANKKRKLSSKNDYRSQVHVYPSATTKGHTGYLTFAEFP